MDDTELLLAEVAQAYAECSTYLDEGSHTTVSVTERGPDHKRQTIQCTFRTAFERDGRFIFEYWERWGDSARNRNQAAIWSDSAGRWNWSMCGSEEAHVDAQRLALGALAGACGGAALDIAGLLMPKLVDRPVLPVGALSMFRSAGVGDGDTCYVVTGESWNGRKEVLWIDRERNLLLRKDRSHVSSNVERASQAAKLLEALDQLPEDHPDRKMMEQVLAGGDARPESNIRTENSTIWRPLINTKIPDVAFVFTHMGE